MSRYIDADILIGMIEAKADTLIQGKEAFQYIAKWIELLPKADVVEVVRCKECKHRTTIRCPMYFEEIIHYYEGDYIESDLIITDYTSDDGFCDKGEIEKGGAEG